MSGVFIAVVEYGHAIGFSLMFGATIHYVLVALAGIFAYFVSLRIGEENGFT